MTTITCRLLSNTSGPASKFPNPPCDIGSTAPKARVVLSGGCFWCTEAVYRQLDGVLDVTSGYAGDSAETANYAAVSSGATNHAEAVRIEYDPSRITFGAILKVFFSTAHDPTHLDRQADDVGRHYRSTLFYETEVQRQTAQAYIAAIDQAKVFNDPVVTTLEPFTGFYPAEGELQNYVALHPDDAYVRKNSLPKVKKTQEWFSDSSAAPTSQQTKAR